MFIIKSKHLTLDDRKAIQDKIENRLSKTHIARSIGKDTSTNQYFCEISLYIY